MIDPDISDAGAAPDTGDRTVRQFAALCGLVLIVAAGRVGYAHGATPRALSLAFAAVAIALIGLVWPRAVRPVFLAAMAVTAPIGAVVSIALLAVMYYVVFTPLAFVFRIAGRDALVRRRHADALTYWTPKEQATDVRSYFRQS